MGFAHAPASVFLYCTNASHLIPVCCCVSPSSTCISSLATGLCDRISPLITSGASVLCHLCIARKSGHLGGWHIHRNHIPLAIPTLKWGARAPNLWKFYVHQNCSKTVYHISQKYELILERQKNRPTRQQVSILERTTVRQKCQF